MAPRHRTIQELHAHMLSLSKHEIGQFIFSLSNKESRTFAAHIAQRDDSDDLTKRMALLASQGVDSTSIVAALSKEEQASAMSRMSGTLEKAISNGDHVAENLALSYKMQLNLLDPETTAYGDYLQRTAKHLEQLGLTNRDIEQERKMSQAMADELLGCWTKMHKVLQSCEHLIQTRWLKLTQSQRKSILLNAWPDMPKGHRPDMDHLLRGQVPRLDKIDMGAFIWPYINLEDLLKPKALLIFLNSRGRNHPCHFAYSDLERAPIFKIRPELIAVLAKNYTVDFLSGQDPLSYGAWIEWDDETKATESIRAGRTVHYEHWSQILQIQVAIMRFLMRCTDQILHDINWDQLPPAVPEPPKLSDQGGVVEKMEIIAREALYRLPGRLDLQRLQALIGAQRSQAIDHAWSLQEDPGYFASTIEDYREHRNELILDEFGDTHPHASDFPLYNKVVRHMITDAHCFVFIWDEIQQRIVHVQDLLTRHSKNISVDRDLPVQLHDQLSELRFFLESVMMNQVGDLDIEFRASPPLRKYYYRANAGDSNMRKFEVRVTEIPGGATSLKRLRSLIEAICNSTYRDKYTLHILLDEFERLVQTDPRAKDLVSAHVAESLSRLSIFAECLHQLQVFQPWSHKIESDVNDNRISFALRYDKIFRHWGLLNSNYQKFETKKLNLLCSPRDGKFLYPVHEHPTRAKVEQMRSAEAALDAFWKAADVHWLHLIHTTPSALVKHIMGERILVRTALWVPQVQTEETKLGNGPCLLDTASRPFSEHAHDVAMQITGGFAKAGKPVKSKTKTKGVITGDTGDTGGLMHVPPSLSVLSPQAVFKVDKRSLRVFRALFHSPNSPNQPGEVAWSELLHAMIALGFGARKLRSSAWHFTPQASVGKRSIQLHEPHPNSKLPFVLARHYGRRLNIAYEWTSESFELE